MTKGAIVYARISTAAQEDNTSLDTQTEACLKLAKAQGVAVSKVYREVYTGAELYDRPRLSEARAEIKSGKYSHLIVYAIDRLSRDPIHLMIVAMECDRAGVELVFVSEPLDSTPEGALIRYVKGYAAQVEREKIRERCVRGKRAIAAAGRIHNAGTELYGYHRDKEAGKRIIFEPEAAIVRQIFGMVTERGISIRGVVRFLNNEGIPTPSSGCACVQRKSISRYRKELHRQLYRLHCGIKHKSGSHPTVRRQHGTLLVNTCCAVLSTARCAAIGCIRSLQKDSGAIAALLATRQQERAERCQFPLMNVRASRGISFAKSSDGQDRFEKVFEVCAMNQSKRVWKKS
jgi:DNA invertase Pin-like site-specific DNA recombinase